MVKTRLSETNALELCLVKGSTQMIRLYQMCLSPLLGNRCRFFPSCSHYAIEALETRGLIGGGRLAIGRLLRCHPWHPGGVDELPKHVKRKGME